MAQIGRGINMAEIKNLNEEKARKNGEITPKAHFERNLDFVDDMDFAVSVAVFNDGDIKTGWSSTNYLRLLGAVEVLRTNIMIAMKEDNDEF